MCHRISEHTIETEKYARFLRGEGLVQELFPEMPASEWEELKTGLCPTCFEKSNAIAARQKGDEVDEANKVK